MYGITNTKFNLRNVDQRVLWSMVLGQDVEPNQLITSPFRADTRANCYLRMYNGIMLFTDWAFQEYNKYTVIHALAHLKGIQFNEAEQLLANFVYHKVPISVNRPMFKVTQFVVTQTDTKKDVYYEAYMDNGEVTYTLSDVDYWAKRDVSYPELLQSKQPCYSVYRYWVDGRAYYPKTYPCYALTFQDTLRFKMYCPYNEKDKRFPLSTAVKNDVWKWETGTPSCIVTKSYKDGLLINKLTGCDTYAFQSEGTIPSDLSFLNKYSKKVIVYDNDQAGVEGAKRLSSMITDSKKLFYPQQLGKDTDDLVVAGFSNIARNMLIAALQ